MKLHSYFRSSASFRVRVVLHIKQLPFDTSPVHLVRNGGEQHAAAYLALNPLGLVPALEDQGNVLTQSAAICEYLDEVYPQPKLLPGDPAQRAWVRAVTNTVACDIHPLNNLRVLNYVTGTLGHDEEAKSAWYRHWIAEGFHALEQMVAARAGQHCLGDQLTMADVFVVPQVWNALRFKCPMENYPVLQRLFDNAMALPAFEQAAPAAQPDAE